MGEHTPIQNDEDLCAMALRLVDERGYRKGWTDDQFATRQALKTADELSEAVNLIHRRGRLKISLGLIDHAGAVAKEHFDTKAQSEFDCWIPERDKESLLLEAIDWVVPGLTLIGLLGGSTQDIIDKMVGDVNRGTKWDD